MPRETDALRARMIAWAYQVSCQINLHTNTGFSGYRGAGICL